MCALNADLLHKGNYLLPITFGCRKTFVVQLLFDFIGGGQELLIAAPTHIREGPLPRDTISHSLAGVISLHTYLRSQPILPPSFTPESSIDCSDNYYYIMMTMAIGYSYNRV